MEVVNDTRQYETMKDLTQGSVMRHLVHMAAFLAVSMVVQTLYLLADLYWVGRLAKKRSRQSAWLET